VRGLSGVVLLPGPGGVDPLPGVRIISVIQERSELALILVEGFLPQFSDLLVIIHGFLVTWMGVQVQVDFSQGKTDLGDIHEKLLLIHALPPLL